MVYIGPTDLIAFIALCINWFAIPLVDKYKKIDALITIQTVHNARVLNIFRSKEDSNLLLGLTCRGCNDRLVPIQMTGRDAVLSIRIASIETAQQQNPILSKEEKMN